MARRRRKRAWVNGPLAKPLAGIIFLCLLWGAYRLGLVDMIGEALVAPLKPD